MPHLLQVCNVGRIVGGTAACAWTIKRAFPDCEHTVLFFNRITKDTATAFSDCEIRQCSAIRPQDVRDIAPDLIILHNSSTARVPTKLPVPTVVYLHSKIRPAVGDLQVACSHWLAERYADSITEVLYQPVPRPVLEGHQPRNLGTTPLTVGRICTPTSQKWPAELVPFYSRLAADHSDIRWEFVGCPTNLQPALNTACNGRAIFHNATWQARQLFCHWNLFLYHHPTLAESFGRTVAEAMRSGCIPIVDNRGGFKEQITRESGCLCNSTDDFSRALSRLRNSEMRSAMSQACQQHADSTFSLATFRQNLLTLLRYNPI